jgi:hypothetical protein
VKTGRANGKNASRESGVAAESTRIGKLPTKSRLVVCVKGLGRNRDGFEKIVSLRVYGMHDAAC